jgi:hypothetical protein
MNDDPHLPAVEDMDGGITIFTKAWRAAFKPVEKAQTARPAMAPIPMRLLGASHEVPTGAAARAYHRKVQETHPDKLSNLGLFARPRQITRIERMVPHQRGLTTRSAWPRRKAAAAQRPPGPPRQRPTPVRSRMRLRPRRAQWAAP